MPKKYTHFVQSFRNGPALVYDNRDDVDESMGYWQIDTDGMASYVKGITNRTFSASDTSRFDDDLNQTQNPRRGLFGTPLFRDSFIGDPLAGRSGNAAGSISDFAEIQGVFRRYLAGKGLNGVPVGPGIFEIVTQLNNSELGMRDDESLLEAYWSSFVATNGLSPETLKEFDRLVGGTPGTGEAIALKAEGLTPAATGTAAGVPDALDPDRDQDDPFTAGNAPVPGGTNESRPGAFPAGRSTLASAVDGTAGGAGAGDGLPGVPGAFDGTEVTPELLREFVDSDWRLGFNAWMNTFRDAGAAGIFLNWLASQANRFIGEYEGRIGAQALAGEVPVVTSLASSTPRAPAPESPWAAIPTWCPRASRRSRPRRPRLMQSGSRSQMRSETLQSHRRRARAAG